MIFTTIEFPRRDPSILQPTLKVSSRKEAKMIKIQHWFKGNLVFSLKVFQYPAQHPRNAISLFPFLSLPLKFFFIIIIPFIVYKSHKVYRKYYPQKIIFQLYRVITLQFRCYWNLSKHIKQYLNSCLSKTFRISLNSIVISLTHTVVILRRSVLFS